MKSLAAAVDKRMDAAKAVSKMRGEDSAQAGAAEKRKQVLRMRRNSCCAALGATVEQQAARVKTHLFDIEALPPTASQREKAMDDLLSGRTNKVVRVKSAAEGRPKAPAMADALPRHASSGGGRILGSICKPADVFFNSTLISPCGSSADSPDSNTPTRTRSTFSRASSAASNPAEPCEGEPLVRGVLSLRRLSAERNGAPSDADEDASASPPRVSSADRSRQRRGSALLDALCHISRSEAFGKTSSIF